MLKQLAIVAKALTLQEKPAATETWSFIATQFEKGTRPHQRVLYGLTKDLLNVIAALFLHVNFSGMVFLIQSHQYELQLQF